MSRTRKIYNTLAIAAFIGAGSVTGYRAGELFIPEQSAERTPGIGDRQAEALTKTWNKINAAHANPGKEDSDIKKLSQEALVKPHDQALQDQIQRKEQVLRGEERRIRSLTDDFLERLFLSEGISEKDGYKLARKYVALDKKSDYAQAYTWWYDALTESFNHIDFSYLDECQKKLLPADEAPDSSTARKVSGCMTDKADWAQIRAVAGGGTSGLAAFGLLTGLFCVARIAADRRQWQRQRPKPPEKKEREVNLKIKIRNS